MIDAKGKACFTVINVILQCCFSSLKVIVASKQTWLSGSLASIIFSYPKVNIFYGVSFLITKLNSCYCSHFYLPIPKQMQQYLKAYNSLLLFSNLRKTCVKGPFTKTCGVQSLFGSPNIGNSLYLPTLWPTPQAWCCKLSDTFCRSNFLHNLPPKTLLTLQVLLEIRDLSIGKCVQRGHDLIIKL